MLKLAFLLSMAASALAQAPATGIVHTPQVDLAYEVYGQPHAATPIIAINGGPGLSHAYMLQNDVWPRIAENRQVVFYDQRGTGLSQHIAPGASHPMIQTMAAQVGDLEAIRAHFAAANPQFDRVDLVGDSYGGLLAMAYVAAHPEHVRRLVLSDSAAPAWKDIVHLLPAVFPDIEAEDAAQQKQLGDTPAAAQAGLLNHFRMIFWSPELRDAYLKKFLSSNPDMGYSPKTGEAVSNATTDLDLTSALPKFHCPTLVITGRYDMNVTPLTAWRMYKAIPGAKLDIFERSGHLPSYEEPDKYVHDLEAFLN